MTKTCARCGKTKPLSEFYKQSASKDGHGSWCKMCMDERRKINLAASKKGRVARDAAYYQANKERIRARGRNYYEAHRDEWTDGELRRNYGITLAEYDAMLEAQDNRCAICGRTPEENGKRLAVDHDHETGEVRCLLCSDCNMAIGLLSDSYERCFAAANYLKGWSRS